MKISRLLATVGVVAMATGVAKAIDYTYSDCDSWNKSMGAGSHVSGTFDITKPDKSNLGSVLGFDPAAQDVHCAKVSFSFSEWDRALEYGKILLGIGNAATSWSTGWFEVDSKTYYWLFDLSDSLLGQLQDGILEYKVKVKDDCRSDFKLNWAKLEVCAETTSPIPPPTHSAPDGGLTLALLGMGLLGVAGIRRKLGA